MSPAHQPHRPRSLRWLGILALAIFCLALVATVWLIGLENFFPSDPGASASTTP
jgi:hypothetical protein